MTLKLYYWPRSSATRVQWALEELGVPHEKNVSAWVERCSSRPAFQRVMAES